MKISKTGSLFSFLLIFLIVIAVPAMAQTQAPTATTGAATAIGLNQATLNGTVNANNETTTVIFEYGLTTGYGLTFAATPGTVTGATATAVSATIYELSPETTYHYRVVATNASGTTYGADMTFTTLSPPPPTTTNAAAITGVDTATLNGTVNAQGLSTTVSFEYGTTAAYGTTVTAAESPISFSFNSAVTANLTGLTAGVTYHFRVVATNTNGTSYGDDMIFTINGSAPTAVTNAATAVGSETATLNGTVNPNGSQTTVSFEYGTDTSYGRSTNALQNPVSGTTDTAVSAVIDDVVPSTTYHYRLVTVNAFGTTYGSDMTFTTLPLPPTAVTGAASAISTTGATLNGTVNANDDAATVTFEYGMDTSYGNTVTAGQSPVSGSVDTAVSAALSGLTNGVTYHYRVAAVNGGGTTYGADMTFTTGIATPTAVTNAATSIGTTTAVFNGTVNAGGESTTVTFEYGPTTAYGRTATADQSPVTGSTDTAVSKTEGALIPATTYHYRVTAVNANGTTHGADMTFTTRAAPTVTTNTATSVGASGATLNGTVNANGDSTTVTFEYGTTTAYGTTVTAVPGTVTGNIETGVGAVLSGLTGNTTYHYRVVGVNANGTTYGADMTFFTVAPAAPTATTNAASSIISTGATLNGTVNAKNASTTVTFEYGTTTAYGTTVGAVQSPVTGAVDTAVSAAITGLSNNTTYHYRVTATNAHGSVTGADMTFTTGFAPAATTQAATAVSGGVATLNGTVNANSFGTTVTFQYGTTTSYGSTVNADPNFLNTADDTPVSAVLTGLTPNTTYHYRVVAQGFGTTNGADMTFTTGSSPTAVTNAATAVTANTATVNGTVNANNTTATVTFQYGLNTSYGKTAVAAQSPVTGTANTAVSADLDSLAPNRTYHYRVMVTSGGDTLYGADMTFTTGGAAPGAFTEAATAVTTTGATLNGEVNAKSDSTTVTFEYGTTTAYGTTVAAVPGTLTSGNKEPVSAVLTGLTANTTYHYRVTATNSSGTSNGADMTFFTNADAPTAVTEAATAVANTTATLHGTVNANGNSTTVTFEFGATTAYGRTVTADQSPVTGTTDTAVSVNLSGLLPDTTYHFRVTAGSSAGTVQGADLTFFTGASAPTVTTQAATNIDTETATLNGTVNANYGDTTVTFEYGMTTAYGTTVTAAQSPVTGSTDTAVSADLTGLTPNTLYHFRAVGQNAQGTTNGADMTFTTAEVVIPTVTTAAVTKITDKSAFSGGNVTDEGGSPVTARGVCWSTSPTPTLADSFTVNDFGPGVFKSKMNQLTESTTYYVRAYATNSHGTAYGREIEFTTDSSNVSVTIIQPREGRTYSGTVSIHATAKGKRGTKSITKVEFYIDDVKIAEDTHPSFKADWDTTGYGNGSYVVKVVATSDTNEQSSDSVTVNVDNSASPPPVVRTSRNRLVFSAVPRGKKDFLVTLPQLLFVKNCGVPGSRWAIAGDVHWLSTTPSSGRKWGLVIVHVDPKNMNAGTYTASLNFMDDKTSDVVHTVDVELKVYPKGSTSAPIGAFTSPRNGSAASGNVSLSGWVLDDISVSRVKIYRSPTAGESRGLKYIGDAEMVDGARPEMEVSHRDYPMNYQAGWGYSLKSHSLPDHGNGSFEITVEAVDLEGNTTVLGKKTIHLNNADTAQPFGLIDTPESGEPVESDTLVSYAWALAPTPYTIPRDGSAITVWVDGQPMGHPVYNQYRDDVAAKFPGYGNSDGAGGYFSLDTTTLTAGEHTISWSVADNAGNSTAVDSRYFIIVNDGVNADMISHTMAYDSLADIEQIPPRLETRPLMKGFSANGEPGQLFLDENGMGAVTVEPLERIQLNLGTDVKEAIGYMVAGDQLRALPVGAVLDSKTGLFSWAPGPGYHGEYQLVFVTKDAAGQYARTTVKVNID